MINVIRKCTSRNGPTPTHQIRTATTSAIAKLVALVLSQGPQPPPRNIPTDSRWGPWLSTMATNFAIALVVAVLIWCVGVGPFLLVHLPITLITGSVGVWLFYVQHQFDPTFWARDGEWTLHEAALYGSSHYDLPGILRWFTANIGVHHVHHLCSRIPYYRLQRALRDHPELREVSRVTLLQPA